MSNLSDLVGVTSNNLITSSITNGDSTHAPDGNSVFDALANKAATNQKLDDFGTPDDNTDLNANTTNHGLLLKAIAPDTGLINVVGIANNETSYTNKLLFDETIPTTQAFGDTATTGSAIVAARRDHKHAMPAGATQADVIALTIALGG
jgi:hypothetical protein